MRPHPDIALRDRAVKLNETYPLLRLYLTRFAWGGVGVEQRARSMLLKWARSAVRDCASDAVSLRVEPERYFRNLLSQIPEWIQPLLIAVAVKDASTRALLPGLSVRVLTAPNYPDQLHLFKGFLGRTKPPALPPDRVALIVPLRDNALDRAWTRWISSAGNSSNARLSDLAHAAQFFAVDTRLSRVQTILEHVTFDVPNAAQLLSRLIVENANALGAKDRSTSVETPRPTVGRLSSRSVIRAAKKIHPRWLEVQEAVGSGALNQPVVLEFIHDVLRDHRAISEEADQALTVAIGNLTDLPSTRAQVLLSAIPRAPQSVGLAALRVVAAGADDALTELTSLPRKSAIDVVGSFSIQVLIKFGSALLAITAADGGDIPATVRSKVGARTSSEVALAAFPEMPANQLPEILLRWRNLGPGRWRAAVIERIEKLDQNELLEFISAAGPIDRRWQKLPIAIRESLLEAWVRARPIAAGLPNTAAQTCPSLVLDAVRWGGDHSALAALLFGEAAPRALQLMKGMGGRRQHPGWGEAARIMRRSGSIPSSLLSIAQKDRKLLQDLVEDALPAFKTAPLKGLDPAAFIVSAMRCRWLAKRMGETFGVDELRLALPRIRARLDAKPRLLSAAELAIVVGFKHAVVLAYLSTRRFSPADKPGTRFDSFYQTWTLPKRKGGTRLIAAPYPWLKTLQRSMLDRVFQRVSCHAAATGFIVGKSIADNAHPHVGKHVVVNVDVAGFFPSTRFSLIRRVIKKTLPIWMSDSARRLAADVCSYAGALPIGAPTSPAISNIVMLAADASITTVAGRHRLSYTRYADDITLSGEDPMQVLPFVQDVLRGLGYNLDHKKTNIFRRGRRQVVTGLVVNDRVSVPRTVRRRLRAAVHRATSKNAADKLVWHGRKMSIQQLEGRIAFTGVAHPEEAKALRSRLHDEEHRS